MRNPHLMFLFVSVILLLNSQASHLKIGRRLLTSVLSVTYRCCLNSYKSMCPDSPCNAGTRLLFGPDCECGLLAELPHIFVRLRGEGSFEQRKTKENKEDLFLHLHLPILFLILLLKPDVTGRKSFLNILNMHKHNFLFIFLLVRICQQDHFSYAQFYENWRNKSWVEEKISNLSVKIKLKTIHHLISSIF